MEEEYTQRHKKDLHTAQDKSGLPANLISVQQLRMS